MKTKFFSWNIRPGFIVVLAIVVMIAIVLAGCGGGANQPTAKQFEAAKAQAAADSISFTENAEIDNIKRRLELTSDPGLTGFVLLLNEMGQPIMYSGVTGKITSGGKRLTRPWDVFNINYDCGSGARCDSVNEAPSDEGTWGSSNPYIYFWTTGGQYIQWNGKYLYSDKPFRTTIEPIVVVTK